MVRLKVVYLRCLCLYLIRFNSLMVRLKAIHPHALAGRNTSFNSLMVRLKEFVNTRDNR